jgi:DNA/RNA endonuclease YhcR with UshA esterase domain
MKLSALVTGFLVLSLPAFAASVAPADAKNHMGESITVEGVVAGIHAAPNGMIRLDLGGHYPNNRFEALIFPAHAAAFDRIDNYIGSLVQISGTIELYRGKPEITLTNAGQIQVITAAHNQKLAS